MRLRWTRYLPLRLTRIRGRARLQAQADPALEGLVVRHAVATMSNRPPGLARAGR